MSDPIQFTTSTEDSETRLDRFLAANITYLTRTALQKFIEKGLVAVDGQPAGKNFRLRPGQLVRVTFPGPETAGAPKPTQIDIKIVYEDDRLMIIDKQAGLVVHPAKGHLDDTLVNALMYLRPDSFRMSDGEVRPGIVHRLDKDTSGLLVVTKDEDALRYLQIAIVERRVERVYTVLVYGKPAGGSFTVKAPIGRHPGDRKRFTIGGIAPRDSVSHFRLLESLPGMALLQAKLETGRTHQIRVHLASVDLPVVGDALYGRRRDGSGLGRQFLHASELSLPHPDDDRVLHFESPLPEDLVACLERLRGEPAP